MGGSTIDNRDNRDNRTMTADHTIDDARRFVKDSSKDNLLGPRLQAVGST
jgi:hypothetical protein